MDEIEAYTLGDDDFDEFVKDSQPKDAMIKWIDGAGENDGNELLPKGSGRNEMDLVPL